jgi:hypothetical protein
MRILSKLNERGKVVVAFIVLVLIVLVTQQAFSQFKVVGYMPSWSGTASEIQYTKLTHINYSFIRPTTTGGLTAVDQPAKLQDIVSRAHAVGTKVGIAVGGWSDLNNTDFQSMAANASYRSAFINNLVNLINTYQLDGVDIDWEYPSDGADPANYSTMMSELGSAMHSRGKYLTAAVSASGYYANGILNTVFPSVDWLNLMVYDGGSGADHSPYSYAVSSLDYWLNTRGLPASKAVLGVPFYARPSWKSFRTLLAEGANPNSDTYNGDYYNGIPTIKQKTNLGFDRGIGGMMFWEASQDAIGQYSLVTAIREVVDQRSGGGGTQSPYGGTVRNIPGTIEAEHYDLGGEGVAYHDLTAGNSGSAFRTDDVDIEATTDAGTGYNVGWIQAGEWLEYTVNVTTAGAYTLDVRVASTSAGKTFHVEINNVNVSGTITVPNTGGWQNWQTVTVSTSSLTTGQKVMKIAMDAGDFNINKVVFSSGSNPPPSVSITSPSSGATFTAPASVTINANASDNGSITKVDFYNGSTLLGTDTSSPYSYSWTSVGAGSYSLTAKATDNLGATTTSSAVSITVNSSGNAPPTASITSPANNASFTAPASITINANASDPGGSVSKVDFFNGSTLLGTDTSSPYSFSWTNVSAGTYSLTAKATDNLGATGTSAAISVTVTGGGGCSYPQYVENGGYVAGSRVKNAGNSYECKPYPYSGWCNGAAWAYGPGTGTYWSDAWTLVGPCAGRMATHDELINQNGQSFEEDAKGLHIYPNPAKSGSGNSLNFVFEKDPGAVNVKIRNLNGAEVFGHHTDKVSAGKLTVELPELPNGLYMIGVHTDSKSWNKKYFIN